MWPNENLRDEDELAETVIEAYSVEDWDPGAVMHVLERGNRRQKKAGRSESPGPELLRAFVATCKPDVGVDLELADGSICDEAEHEEELYNVAIAGNGDRVACDIEGQTYYLDHEAGMRPDGDGVSLSTMLAAWLFHDEFVRRGLEEHPTIEDHAREAFPADVQYVFSRIS